MAEFVRDGREKKRKRRIWKHRLRSAEEVHVAVVTKGGKLFVEVVVDAALAPDCHDLVETAAPSVRTQPHLAARESHARPSK